MHKTLHINVEAASCGIWQPLKWRGYFLLNKAWATAEEAARQLCFTSRTSGSNPWVSYSARYKMWMAFQKGYCGREDGIFACVIVRLYRERAERKKERITEAPRSMTFISLSCNLKNKAPLIESVKWMPQQFVVYWFYASVFSERGCCFFF